MVTTCPVPVRGQLARQASVGQGRLRLASQPTRGRAMRSAAPRPARRDREDPGGSTARSGPPWSASAGTPPGVAGRVVVTGATVTVDRGHGDRRYAGIR